MVTLQSFNESNWQPMTAFLLEILDGVSSSEVVLELLHPVTGGVL
jgi:hypothetical protein